MSDPDSDSKYRFDISLSAIQLLGEQLYSNVPKCISEAVANSWDADATKVQINFDTDEEIIEIIDNGRGMSKNDVNQKYLNVGYRKRPDEGDITERYERPVMGRKGVGKLALFGIANTIEVYTKEKNGDPQAFEIDAESIREEIQSNNPTQRSDSTLHSPPEISDEKFADHWPAGQDEGTVIRLTEINKQVNSYTESSLISRIARRFSVIKEDNFAVHVNDHEVQVTDRNVMDKAEYLWIIGDPEDDYREYCDEDQLEGVSHIDGEFQTVYGTKQINGWIASSDKPSDLKINIGGKNDENENLNKIHLIVRGKMAKENMLTEISSSKHFTEYLFGDIHADFMDDTDEEDIHTTNRENFKKEDWRYINLRSHLTKLARKISEEWDDYREDQGTDEATEIEPVREWYENLDSPTQKEKASKLFGKINRMTPNESEREEFYKFGVLAFERMMAKDNLTKLEEIDPEDIEAISRVFVDLEDIEAAQYHQIIKQRLRVVEKFEGYVDKNALEDTLQQHLFDNLWLLDPSWERATGTEYQESRVYKLFQEEKEDLDEKLSEEQKKGRVDLKYQKTANQHVIVELKRSERSVTQGELQDQVNKYQSAFRKVLDQCDRANETVEAVVVLGKLPKGWRDDPELRKSGERSLSEQNIRVITYDELLENARQTYGEYLEQKESNSKIEEVLESIEDTFREDT